MWCDDFDMDLLKVIPGAADAMAPAAGILLYTHGSLTNGWLNHPSVWMTSHGAAAFFGFDAPHKPESFVTNNPRVLCDFEQAMRDAWPHSYTIVLHQPPGISTQVIWGTGGVLLNRLFNELMYHRRGLRRLPDDQVRLIEQKVLISLLVATERLAAAFAAWSAERA